MPFGFANTSSIGTVAARYAPRWPWRRVASALCISRKVHQPYSEDKQRYFHGYTLTEHWEEPTTPNRVRDLLENELVEDHVRRFRRMPTMEGKH